MAYPTFRRHLFVTSLQRTGVIFRLAQHADIRLTLRIWTVVTPQQPLCPSCADCPRSHEVSALSEHSPTLDEVGQPGSLGTGERRNQPTQDCLPGAWSAG